MNEKFESQDLNKIEISSSKGIKFRDEGDRFFLDISIELVKTLAVGAKFGKDALNELHAEVFSDSYFSWGQEEDDFYTIELGTNSTQRQIQKLVDKIEN